MVTRRMWQVGPIITSLMLLAGCRGSTVEPDSPNGLAFGKGPPPPGPTPPPPPPGPPLGGYTPVFLPNLAGGTTAEARDINDSDLIVGWAHDGVNGTRAAAWSQGTVTDLGTPTRASYNDQYVNDVQGYARGVGSTGVVVGYFQVDRFIGGRDVQFDTAFRWTPTAGFVRLPGLGGQNAVANAVNGAGIAVGRSGRRAVRWTPGGRISDLNPVGATSSEAVDINDAGWIVGWASGPWGRHAYLWPPSGSPIDITPFSSTDAYDGYGLNEQRVVVGSLRQPDPIPDQVFRWTPPSLIATLVIPSCPTHEYAYEISDLGRIAGTCFGSGSRAWTLRNGVDQLLALPSGHAISRGYAVNTCGTVVGSSKPTNGSTRAVKWVKLGCDR